MHQFFQSLVSITFTIVPLTTACHLAKPRIAMKGCGYGKMLQLFTTAEMRCRSHEKAGLDKRKSFNVQMALGVVSSVGSRPVSWGYILLMVSFSSVMWGLCPVYKGGKDMKGDFRGVMKFGNTRKRRESWPETCKKWSLFNIQSPF